MLAGLMYGLNIVVIDDFSSKQKVELMVKNSVSKYVFVNHKTSLIATFLFKGLKKINIDKCIRYNTVYNFQENQDKTQIVLTTFTSGTTGNCKLINRSFSDLEKQVKLIKDNFLINNDDVIVCMLPIYVLFSLFNGNTTCVLKKICENNLLKVKGNIILGKIANILNVEEKMESVEKLYLGGAYIYQDEANKILRTFCNADISYVYGASEGAIIGINKLSDYVVNKRFKFIKGINVEIIEEVNNAGEIVITGDSVLSNEHYHKTGDIGYIKEEYLYILGRKKYSSLADCFYNYVNDEVVRKKYNLSKAFSIWFNGREYIFYEGKKKIKGLTRVRKMPYDLKHKTKVDYKKFIDNYMK